MTQAYQLGTTSVWQRIFLQSKVNGALYEEQQIDFKWPWPEYTYLQRRLGYLRTDRTHGLWELRQAAQKDMTDLDVVELGSVSGSDATRNWWNCRESHICRHAFRCLVLVCRSHERW